MSENDPLNNDNNKNIIGNGNTNGSIIILPTTNGQFLQQNGNMKINDNDNENHQQQQQLQQHVVINANENFEPPDGGTRAWIIMISAFLCNGVIFGIINTYGVLHSYLQDQLTNKHDTEASSKAALVGSLTIGTTFLLSPVAGMLTDKIGLRRTTFLGGILSVGGLYLSSLFTTNIEALYITYGIMFGLGAALAYTPTLAILGHYFKRYLGKVNGFVTAGSSVFTIILPPCLDYFVKQHGLEMTLQGMALIACFIILCSFVYKPLLNKPKSIIIKEQLQLKQKTDCNILLHSIINVDIWKRKRYVIWSLCVPLALFGYFVPYVHMVKFVQNRYPGESENLPVMCIGISSGIGRILFGILADMPKINRIFLQQIALVFIGILTMLLPITNSYILLIGFTLIMGLFDGCFISLLGPIAHEICGPHGAAQAIGFLLGLSSLPLTVGPPIAGKIFDTTGSYTMPFILAGIPPLIGATVMFLIRCVKDDGFNQNQNLQNHQNHQNDIETIHCDGNIINSINKNTNWNTTTTTTGIANELENEPNAEVPLMNGNHHNHHHDHHKSNLENGKFKTNGVNNLTKNHATLATTESLSDVNSPS